MKKFTCILILLPTILFCQEPPKAVESSGDNSIPAVADGTTVEEWLYATKGAARGVSHLRGQPWGQPFNIAVLDIVSALPSQGAIGGEAFSEGSAWQHLGLNKRGELRLPGRAQRFLEVHSPKDETCL